MKGGILKPEREVHMATEKEAIAARETFMRAGLFGIVELIDALERERMHGGVRTMLEINYESTCAASESRSLTLALGSRNGPVFPVDTLIELALRVHDIEMKHFDLLDEACRIHAFRLLQGLQVLCHHTEARAH